MGRNKIEKIENLRSLSNLKRLDIQSNRLTEIGTGLSTLTNLTELYLSHNAITKIEGLETLVNLTTLDLSANRIEKIENIATLLLLEEFWINDNKIASFDELKCLENHSKLNTIYLERNPFQLDSAPPLYKTKILSMLPTIIQLDALPIIRPDNE